MTTEVLRKKTARYITGLSVPAEKRQIQNWLSCTGEHKPEASAQEREMIEDEIVFQVRAYAESTLYVPYKPEPWWKKITAFF
jgi:hypothetical protein